jgi:hypothetical protein
MNLCIVAIPSDPNDGRVLERANSLGIKRGTLGGHDLGPSSTQELLVDDDVQPSSPFLLQREFSIPDTRFRQPNSQVGSHIKGLSKLQLGFRADMDVCFADMIHYLNEPNMDEDGANNGDDRLSCPLLGPSLTTKTHDHNPSMDKKQFNYMNRTSLMSVTDLMDLQSHSTLVYDVITFTKRFKSLVNVLLRRNIRLLESHLYFLSIIPECRSHIEFTMKRKLLKVKVERLKRLKKSSKMKLEIDNFAIHQFMNDQRMKLKGKSS